MLRISKKVEYALIGLLHMSHKDRQELTTAKELANTYHIPQELMGKVLQQLARGQVIRSVQGVKGGYTIQQPLEQISLSMVYYIIDGPFRIVSCLRKKNRLNCKQHSFCTIRDPMEIIQNKLELFFDQLTLKDLEEEVFADFQRKKKVKYAYQRQNREA